MANRAAPIDPAQIEFARDNGLSIPDIMRHMHCGRVRARRIFDAAGKFTLPSAGYRKLPVADPANSEDRIAAIVPSGDTARHSLLWGENTGTRFSFYLRARSLAQPIWFDATDMGTDVNGRVYAADILGRAIIENGGKRPRFSDAVIDSAVGDFWNSNADYLTTKWPEHADFFVLDEPYSNVDVPLGFADRGGIAGVRHVNLAKLRDATAFKGLPSA
ncbi:hypothetical protein [Corynebacterium sp.]|uniref:hypothetical protein n=1 Tax=Corynebacterium sp. TaxID=1720 RepID=UPI0028AA9BAC|nr:hypothetical protein [Corynebacterium sp.]